MLRKIILVAAIATILSTSVVAQELGGIGINTNEFETQSQARVNSLPTGYFADQSDEGAIESNASQSGNQLQNLLVIFGFATMLTTGGVITGFCIVKQRNSTRQRTAPPVRLCV